jgi:hypothetical protein
MSSQLDSTTLIEDARSDGTGANKSAAQFPSLYQINTRVLMQELATSLGRPRLVASSCIRTRVLI